MKKRGREAGITFGFSNQIAGEFMCLGRLSWQLAVGWRLLAGPIKFEMPSRSRRRWLPEMDLKVEWIKEDVAKPPYDLINQI